MTNFDFQQFPVFKLGDIELRQLQETDSFEFYHYMNHPQVRQFVPAVDTPSSPSQAVEEISFWRNLFNNKQGVYWCIAARDTGKMIGSVGFNYCSFFHSRGELSYDLNPEYWGQGIMKRAIKKVISFGFKELNLIRIQALVSPENKASIGLLDKLNFNYEGLLKKYARLPSGQTDYYIYSLING